MRKDDAYAFVLDFDLKITCKDCKFYNAGKKLCTYYNMISKPYQYCKAGQKYGIIRRTEKTGS